MSKVEARLDRVECGVRVSGAPTIMVRPGRPDGTEIAPDKVQWEAYSCPLDGVVYESVTTYGTLRDGSRWNVSWYLDDLNPCPQPSWIPAPPAWYVDAVAELRAAAEDLSRGGVSR